MIRRQLYLTAPGDVPALEAEADRLLGTADRPNLRTLIAGTGRLDPDLAMMLAYRACFRGANGDFLTGIESVPIEAAPLPAAISVLVVPGLNFARHPETGADGRLVRSIGARLGADVTILNIDPRGSPTGNGAMLADQLAKRDDRPTWLVSISKGTADLRAAMALLGGWPNWLSGWINLSGVFAGTPVADRLTSFSMRGLMIRALVAATRLDFANISEMRTDSDVWRTPVRPPFPNRLIHVLGFPPSWAIEMRISHHYRWLTDRFGPNDGVVPLVDCLAYPGRVLPVWGADHFMRVSDLSRLVYRLFRFASAVS